jgi:DNA-binding NarL/FixJ family response regulator
MRTLLVDDHTLFREGLAMLMARDFPMLQLSEAGSLAEALVHLQGEARAELVLLDLALPDSQGLDGLARVRELAPEAKVLVLSADESSGTVIAAIDGGAAGFIPKTASASALCAALQVVLAGGVSLPPSVVSTGTRAGGALPSQQATDALGLSPRQLEVLALLIDGRPNKLICRQLDLSESTVKTHLAAIFRKLDVNTRTQAVVAAARLGLRLPVLR